jgi:penicillin-binding protein 2
MKFKDRTEEVALDEIFLDSSNLPQFDTAQFEGRIEKPIAKRTIGLFSGLFLILGMVLIGKVTFLQVVEGKTWSDQAESNRLRHAIVFPARGLITDRNEEELAWNTPFEDRDFFGRAYTERGGFAHLLGFLHYPKTDTKGVYFRTEYEAPIGAEAAFHDRLSGSRGIRIIETDALGNVTSENTMERSQNGETIVLGIDADVQERLFDTIKSVSLDRGFTGGAGGIVDIETGELLALTSYPEFDSNVMTAGTNTPLIAKYNSDESKPFLDRAVAGLYAPGSIMKPIVAIGGLNEGIITPNTGIYSSGSLRVPNPFLPGAYTQFNDWKAHGLLDMRRAIAWSSNVYFYELGGGFQGQKGLGIYRLKKYANMFGFGTTTGIELPGEAGGNYPDPEWKEKVFPGDPWRIGDTYFTAIGQYGVQVTLLQALKESGLIAGKGKLPAIHVEHDVPKWKLDTTSLGIPDSYFTVIHEGMRQGVREGTAKGLDTEATQVAAKTGTAELGVSKKRVNSWVIGFFPYEKPKYAFAVVMERGPKGNTFGATYVMRQVMDWMGQEKPEYVGRTKPIRVEPLPILIATSTDATSSTPVTDIDESPLPVEE